MMHCQKTIKICITVGPISCFRMPELLKSHHCITVTHVADWLALAKFNRLHWAEFSLRSWQWFSFFTVFTRVYHSSQRLSWAIQIHSTSSYSTSLRPVLVLFFHLCLYLLSRFFYSGFRTTVLYTFLNFPMLRARAPHISSSLIWSP
jgi:hypothetical protein